MYDHLFEGRSSQTMSFPQNIKYQNMCGPMTYTIFWYLIFLENDMY